jgi:chromosome segregation ATPase
MRLMQTAMSAVADRIAQLTADVKRLTKERDLAIAHDRQPYPTAEAYEKACAALNKHREAHEKERVAHERTKAKLAEARRDYDDERRRANEHAKVIDQERAAHARTQAELTRLRDFGWAKQVEVLTAENAHIKAERDAARAHQDELHAECERLNREYVRIDAEAAAMREALGNCRGEINA